MKIKNLTRFAFAALALAPIAGFAQTLAPSQDAYYVPGNGSNFGTATTITVGGSSSIGLVQFDLTQLPAGVTAAQIQKATLTLFLDHVNSAGTINIDTVSASTPWGELTVTGMSGISAGSAVATGVPVATADTFIAMDATGGGAGMDHGAEFKQRLHASGEFDYERSVRPVRRALLPATRQC